MTALTRRSLSQVRLLGERAREDVRDMALNLPVTWEIPEGTPLRDPYNRVLAYVSVDGVDLGGHLIGSSLAELRREPHPRSGRYRMAAVPLLH